LDLGEDRRRWRTLDVGTTLTYLEAYAPRVTCRRHGVWCAQCLGRGIRRGSPERSRMAVNCSQTAVAALMRIARRTVGGICARVAAEARSQRDLMAGLRRIGIDEISHRKVGNVVRRCLTGGAGRTA
jgi:transposase